MRPAGSSAHLDDTGIRPGGPPPRHTPRLAEQAAALRAGRLDLLEDLAERERLIARREPEVRALVDEPERFARLERAATELLERHGADTARPPLFGILVGVKDVLRVGGLPTRAGTRLPPETFAGEPATAAAVERLLAAGALVLGKTVSTELAYFAPGPTRNPRAPEHTPGGSSSGSAAAVAAGYCPLALGTQTIASTVRPAAYCGIAGYKPTHGRIPRAGTIPLAASFDDIGVFAPAVADLALAAAVLVDGWNGGASADAGAVVPPRLAVPVGPYLERASAAAQSHLAVARARLAASGVELVDVPLFADFEDVVRRHSAVVAAEAYRAHHELLERFAAELDPRTRALLEAGAAIGDDELAAHLAGCAALRDALRRTMDAEQIDAWLTPAASGPAPRGHGATGDPVMSLPWSQAGMPSVAVPAGTTGGGLPLGLQLVARGGDDERLLAWASGLAEVCG